MVSAILATGLYADGQYEDALALFDKALANAEASGSAMGGQAQVTFQRAMVEYALGRPDEAAADLEKAVAIDPGLFAAHYNLAIYLRQHVRRARCPGAGHRRGGDRRAPAA